jgi:hypothetical protein
VYDVRPHLVVRVVLDRLIWRRRVPNECQVLVPHVHRGAETSPLVGTREQGSDPQRVNAIIVDDEREATHESAVVRAIDEFQPRTPIAWKGCTDGDAAMQAQADVSSAQRDVIADRMLGVMPAILAHPNGVTEKFKVRREISD